MPSIETDISDRAELHAMLELAVQEHAPRLRADFAAMVLADLMNLWIWRTPDASGVVAREGVGDLRGCPRDDLPLWVRYAALRCAIRLAQAGVLEAEDVIIRLLREPFRNYVYGGIAARSRDTGEADDVFHEFFLVYFRESPKNGYKPLAYCDPDRQPLGHMRYWAHIAHMRYWHAQRKWRAIVLLTDFRARYPDAQESDDELLGAVALEDGAVDDDVPDLATRGELAERIRRHVPVDLLNDMALDLRRLLKWILGGDNVPPHYRIVCGLHFFGGIQPADFWSTPPEPPLIRQRLRELTEVLDRILRVDLCFPEAIVGEGLRPLRRSMDQLVKDFVKNKRLVERYGRLLWRVVGDTVLREYVVPADSTKPGERRAEPTTAQSNDLSHWCESVLKRKRGLLL